MNVKVLSGRRAAAVGLFCASLLHNAEEGITFAQYRPAALKLVHGVTGPNVPLPTPSVFRLALLVVTVAVAGCLIWASTGNSSPAKERGIRLVALMLLINVFIPHVPAALAFGGYAPGLVTAVLVNLPLAILVLLMTRRRAALRSSSQTAL